MTSTDFDPAPALPPGQWWVAALLGLAVAAFHLFHGAALSHSVLMQSFNWLFDFDTSRFVGAWCTAGADVARDLDVSFVARHALSLSVRPVCLALAPLAGDPGLALMALAALCVGAPTAVAYVLAASFCAAEPDRVLVGLGWAGSVHPLMLGLIPETFGLAMLGIGLHMALLARGGVSGLGARPVAIVSLFLNLGITVTNAALNLVSSAVLAWRRISWRTWLGQQAKVWLLGGLALLLVTLVAAAVFTPSLLGPADAVAKRVWWTVNINRGEPATLTMVVVTFLLYSFVAPVPTVIDLPAPDGHPMLDFRTFEFAATGWAALALWSVAFAFSILLVWRRRDMRPLVLVAAGWLLFNVVLHWYWQYRGSIYLYGAHTCFVLFTVLVMGYGAALKQYPVMRVRGFALLLVALSAINNYGVYRQVIGFVLNQPSSP